MSLPFSAPHIDRERGPGVSPTHSIWFAIARLPALFRSHTWLIVGCAVLAMLIVGSFAALKQKTYTSTASFVPQTKPTLSGLAGLASQLGVNPTSGEVGQSSQFYIELIRSHTVLWAVANAAYTQPTKRGPVTGTLIKLYGMDGFPTSRQRDAILKRLTDDIAASVSRLTGMVVLRVTSIEPSLAQQIAQRVLQEVNTFNARTRQSQAAQERTFAEGRLAQMRGELRDAENRLQYFLQENRDFKSSAKLSFEEDRLAREVAEKQQVVTSLAASYEQARIEEVRDRSVITVVDLPEIPSHPNPRNLAKKTVVALLVGSLLGVLAALLSTRGLPWRVGPEPTV